LFFFQVFQKGLISLQANVEKRVDKRNEILQLFELAIQEDVKLLSKDIAAVQIAANVIQKQMNTNEHSIQFNSFIFLHKQVKIMQST
jgi:hypothetical protein